MGSLNFKKIILLTPPKLGGTNEVGEKIPFPVWMIQSPILEINFEPNGPNTKHIVKKSFLNSVLEVGVIIPISISYLENQF